jgi:hypothetical protein
MKRFPLFLLTAFFATTTLFGTTSLFGISGDDDLSESGSIDIEFDRNNDGLIDYFIRHNDKGEKLYEELDFNYDGEMDDFYYYTRGILEKREIDSNYDMQVDIWVYIHEGVYIIKYERDTDYDGEIDQVRDFSKNESLTKS